MDTGDASALKIAGHLSDALNRLADKANSPGQRETYERMSTEAAAIWRGLKEGEY